MIGEETRHSGRVLRPSDFEAVQAERDKLKKTVRKLRARPHFPDEGLALTKSELAIIARCLREIGKNGFMKGDGFTVQMEKAGPYREIMQILANA